MGRRIRLAANTVTGGPSLVQWADVEARLGQRLDAWLYMNGWPGGRYLFTSQLADLAARPQVTPIVAFQPAGLLSAVLDGSLNVLLDQAIADAKAVGRTSICRLAHEFNGTWTPYGVGSAEDAATFVKAWRYVVGRFRDQAAPVEWAWTMTAQWPTASTKDPEPYWPGDAYVDWIGLDGYQNLNASAWKSYADIFGPSYDQLAAAHPAKRFMVAEFGVAGDDGRGSKSQWLRDMLLRDLHVRTPKVELITMWDRNMPGEGDYRVDSTLTDQGALRSALAEPRIQGAIAQPRLRRAA